jgi:hypothetical protein
MVAHLSETAFHSFYCTISNQPDTARNGKRPKITKHPSRFNETGYKSLKNNNFFEMNRKNKQSSQ